MDFHWYCVCTGHKYWFVHLNVGMWIKSLLPFFCLLVDLFARFGVMPSRAPYQHTCTHTHHYRVLFQWNVISWYFYSLSYSRMSLSFCAAIWASSSVYCLFSWRFDGCDCCRCCWYWCVVSMNLITCTIESNSLIICANCETAHKNKRTKSHKFIWRAKWARWNVSNRHSLFVEPIKLSFDIQR